MDDASIWQHSETDDAHTAFDKSGVSEVNAPIRYQFLIDGDTSDHVNATFPDMQVASTMGGYTSLHGPVTDYLAMRAIMARLDSLGLTIAELRRLPD